MKYFDWDKKKNDQLKQERNVSFEEVILSIKEGGLLDNLVHPNKKKYPKQKIYVVKLKNYAYLVPYVEDESKVFLKTIIPSRKATKKYLLKVQK